MIRKLPALLLVGALAGQATAQQQMPASPVVAAPVVRREVAPRRSFVGTVRAARTSLVGAETAGRVAELLGREGLRVKRGEPLARFDTHRVEIELRGARADLAVAESEVQELENGSRKEEIRQGEARVASAKAGVAFAQWDLASAQSVRTQGGMSEDDVRRATLALAAAEEHLHEEEAALELLRAGPRAEHIAQAKARAARASADVAALEDELARHSVLAPFDGIVVAERTESGAWVKTGDPVVELAALDEIDVRVGVVEDVVGALRIGSDASVVIGSLGDRVFAGRVRAIVPRGDDRTRTFPVLVRVPNELRDGVPVLMDGMFARVSLAVGEPASALVVPKDALVLGGPSPVVYVVAAGEGGAPATVRPVPVQAGEADGGGFAVTGELREGDLVVTRGNERLRPGQAVAVRAAADQTESR